MTPDQRAFFESFYEKHFGVLVAYAFRFLKDWKNAEVATQEAFLTGMRRIDRFYGSQNPMGWIKKVIRKTAANMQKVQDKRSKIVLPLENLTVPPCVNDHYDAVDSPQAHSAEILTDSEYALFRRIVIEGYPCKEAAIELGITEGACRKRLERILKKLRMKWDEDGS